MAHGNKRRGRAARSQSRRFLSASNNRLASRGLARSLRMESLEGRDMLAVLFVNNLGDLDQDGNPVVGSLRQAIQLANQNNERDIIHFRHYLFENGPATIGLDGRANGGAFELTHLDGVDIVGPGANLLTINAAANDRIFHIDDGNEDEVSFVTISGVTLSGGSPRNSNEDGRGGAILNRESLTLTGVEISGNTAVQGGGGIFNESGFVRIDGSLIRNNTSIQGGGGIQNGLADQTDVFPRTDIVNSTITGNTAIGVPADDKPTGYGGGVLNLAGTVNIAQSTIFGNSTSVYGGGVASLGFDPEADDETGEPTVMAGTVTTNIRSSIIVGNTGPMDAPDDVAGIGMTEDDEMPMPFIPQIHSEGYNIFGTLINYISINPDIVPPGMGPSDVIHVDPNSLFIDDPINGGAWLNDFGGVLPVFMPDINKVDATLGANLAIDRGDPDNVEGDWDQRGYQFVRDYAAAGGGMDIGAAEVQIGTFLVDNLVDELDGRYETYLDFINGFAVQRTAFSLRDALVTAEKNQLSGLPGTTEISFSPLLTDDDLNPDPVPGTPARTILLTLGQVNISIPVLIVGPAFDVEIDATGNDPTPAVNNGDGTRVLFITSDVEMNNLTIRGGDRQEFGGGVFIAGNATMRNMTFLDNATTGKGGAIYVASGDVLIDSTTINNNFSSSSGGGVYVAGGTVVVHNSTISGNTGNFHGGGIANGNGDLTIRYSTITLNTAGSTLGSGVASYRNGAATTDIRSSIIAGNTTNDVQHVSPGTSNITSLGYNLVGNGNAVVAGLFNQPGDQSNILNPMLAPLIKLGGRTAVHRLQPGSPAIDAGDPNAAGLGEVPDYDQRGFPFDRVVDGNGDSDARIDIGAFEIQTGVLLVGDGSAAEGSYPTFIGALADANLSPLPETIVFLDTWAGENFAGGLIAITDSVTVVGLGSSAMRFFGNPQLTITIDDGTTTMIDVAISGIRFENGTQVVSKENLSFDDMLFVNNASASNGGAISQENGKLAISNSNFIGNSSNGINGGGAIHVLNGDLEIVNTFLSGNTTGLAGGKGGAIYIRNGDFTADYLYLTGNASNAGTGDGGAVYARDANVHLSNAIISANRASGSNARGGGMAFRDTQTTLVNPIVSFNSTTGLSARGGGIFLQGGSLNVEGGTLFQNRTTGQNGLGAAIATVNGDVTVDGVSVSQNSTNGADAHGGAFYVQDGNLTVSNSALFNNSTRGSRADGGAIYSNTSLTGKQTTIVNSTISGNSTQGNGGGVYNADGLTVIKHSTITKNSTPYFGMGAGVATFGSSATTRTDVGSSIIAGNTSSVAIPGNLASDVDRVGGTFQDTFNSLGYNLIGMGLTEKFSSATNDFFGIADDAQIGLGSLTNNGGPTLTHAILDGSLAINRGNPNATGAPTTDQRGTGFDRVKNGRMDIGAFESDFTGALPGDYNGDGVVNGRDFLAWQRGQSPNSGSAGDLADWQANYGTSSSVVAAVVTTEEVEEPQVAALVVEDIPAADPVELASVPASSPVLVGWIVNDTSAGKRPVAEVEEFSLDAAYLAAFEADFDIIGISEADADFGDIATSRPMDSDPDELAAEDAVFDLIGAGAL